MHTASSLILNSIKQLAVIPDKIHLISPTIMESIGKFKKDITNSKNINLDLEETLIALSIGAATNPTSQTALEKLKDAKKKRIAEERQRAIEAQKAKTKTENKQPQEKTAEGTAKQ